MPLGGSISLLLVSFEPFQWSAQSWGRFLFLNNWFFCCCCLFPSCFSYLLTCFFYLSWRHFASLRVICAIFNISPSLKKCKCIIWSFSLFSSTSVPVEMDCIADMLYSYTWVIWFIISTLCFLVELTHIWLSVICCLKMKIMNLKCHAGAFSWQKCRSIIE